MATESQMTVLREVYQYVRAGANALESRVCHMCAVRYKLLHTYPLSHWMVSWPLFFIFKATTTLHFAK